MIELRAFGETFDLLIQALKDDCIDIKVADEARSACPSTAQTDDNVNRVQETIKFAEKDVHLIVSEDLPVRKIFLKLVPKDLSNAQKHQR
ncbi:hypothetical protein J6590_084223 [Homalodisca vitripennis]|nr:hypothetical protein J6590_084223 [Homalodisca vitripennis]